LLGWNNDFKNYTVLAIDRIINYREISKEFINSEKKNMLHLLKNIIGVSIPKEKEIQKIEIEVIKTSVPYFKTKPLHSSQKLKVENDRSALFSLSLIPNYELEQLLLSFGENLVVRKPEDFKEHMRKRISELKSQYSNP
jgi:predicted DNA-binding transcriptional regulator YafY